jgi:hypothetical protein
MILEPETATLFVGWGHLVAFAGGTVMLLLSAESLSTDNKNYTTVQFVEDGITFETTSWEPIKPSKEADVKHWFVMLAGLWFTCELIWVPEKVFGKTKPGTSLVHILRTSWVSSMGALALMATGIHHNSDIISTDLVYYSRLAMVALGGTALLLQIVARTIQLITPPKDNIIYTMLWPHTNDSSKHGWKTIRWYEDAGRRSEQSLADFITKVASTLLLVACPIISVFSELKRLVDEDEDEGDDHSAENNLLIGIAHILLAVMLVVDVVPYTMSAFNEPIHSSVVLTNFYIALRFHNLQSDVWLMAFAPLVAKIVIEFVYGSYTVDYFEFFPGLFTPRAVYRLFYTAAIWTGIVAIVAWTIGWYSDWIEFDVSNGSIVQALLDTLEALEDAIRNFLQNLESIVGFLTMCGGLKKDPSLMDPTLLDEGGDDPDLISLSGSTLGLFATKHGIEFWGPKVDGSREVAECCICRKETTESISDQFKIRDEKGHDVAMGQCPEPQLDLFNPGLGVSPDRCPSELRYDRDGWVDNYNYVEYDWVLADAFMGDQNTRPPPNMDALRAMNATEHQCRFVTKTDDQCTKFAGDDDDPCADKDAAEKLNGAAGRQQKVVLFNQTGLDATKFPDKEHLPANWATDTWVDPAYEMLNSDAQELCEDIACGTIIAVMVSGTAASFIPFVGGAISFTIKTLGKIAWQLFKLIKRMATKFKRFNRRRKKFRKKRTKLKRLIDAANKAKKIGQQGIKASANMIYPFLPLFVVGFLAIFVGFWKRADSGGARSSLAGLLVGLLVANVICMFIVRHIPTVANGLAGALPGELLRMKVDVRDGWRWMEYSAIASSISCGCWMMALFMNFISDLLDFVSLDEQPPPTRSKDDDDDREQQTLLGTETETELKVPTHWTTTAPFSDDDDDREKQTLLGTETELKVPTHWTTTAQINSSQQEYLDNLSDAVFSRDNNKKSTAWISNLVWLVPAAIILANIVVNNKRVFQTSAVVQSEIFAAVSEMSNEEGAQEYSREMKDDSGKMNVCELVGLAVTAAINMAANAVGTPIQESIDLLKNWYDLAFFNLRQFVTQLVDLPDIDLTGISNMLLLVVIFGCPAAACAIASFGVVASLVPSILFAWVPTKAQRLVNLDMLHTLLYFLGFTGLTIVLTVFSMAAVITSIKIPFFTLRVETTPVLMNGVLCNILVLISFANHAFNRAVPLFSVKETKILGL